MCGIFGYTGKGDAPAQCVRGLKFLEYRGYDSWGIATCSEGVLTCVKKEGKLSTAQQVSFPQSTLAIGHTRWATHGGVSDLNAHPHIDQKKTLALVHNGILENYRALRKELEAEGVVFATETDSEVIAQLIARFYEGDLVAAVRQALTKMKGFWGICLIHKNHPGVIVAFSRENPLVVGINSQEKESYISSDPQAFMRADLDLYFLKNEEIAYIAEGETLFFSEDATLLEKSPEKYSFEEGEISKGDHDHYMLKEILEQPKALRHCLLQRCDPEQGEVYLEAVGLSHKEAEEIDEVLLLGCGSAWHAASIGALFFQEWTPSLRARAEIASEYRYSKQRCGPRTLVVAVSQSGETFDTVAAVRALKQQGARVIAVCNVMSSTLVRAADFFIPLRAGPEISVCSTKAFTCFLAALALIALRMACLKKSLEKSQVSALLQEFLAVPAAVEQVLAQTERIELLAKQYASFSHFFFIGRQSMYPTAQEAALKLKEISYLNASAYAAGELKHGPIALLDEESVVIGLCGHEGTYEKMMSNLAEAKARKAQVIAFIPWTSSHQTGAGLDEFFSEVLWIPYISDAVAPILYSVTCQLFAYYIAKERGREIDQPRNLAKSVTVE